MTSKLAIHGGPPTVPEGLKKTWPQITQDDRDAVLAVLERNVFTSDEVGPEAMKLEEQWAQFTGTRYALAVNSGTAAIHLALVAAGVGARDEVITTAYTFGGTFQPVLHQHAIPIFVDIDPQTYNLDVKQIEAKITDRTKALLPVHIHGLPADMREILALGKKYGLAVIEDAAQAHGATYQGKSVGAVGDMGCFSLNATKNLPGGEGGLFTTDSEHYFERAKIARTFGEKFGPEKERFRPYVCYGIGWNYRQPELTAAFVRSQLSRLPASTAIAQRNGQYLTQELAKIDGLIGPHVPSDRTSIYHKYRLRFDTNRLDVGIPAIQLRDKLVEALSAEGVAVTLWHFKPVPSYPLFQGDAGDADVWRGPLDGRDTSSEASDYPETVRALESSIIVNSETYPICNQDMELMEHYVTAFQKIFDHLNEFVQ